MQKYVLFHKKATLLGEKHPLYTVCKVQQYFLHFRFLFIYLFLKIA